MISKWNFQSMCDLGKTHNVILEMNKLIITIMGISEARWVNCRQRNYKTNISITREVRMANIFTEFQLCWTRLFGDRWRILSPSHHVLYYYNSKCTIEYSRTTLSKCMLQLKTNDEEMEYFNRDVDKIMNLNGNKDVTLLLGGMNVNIGQG